VSVWGVSGGELRDSRVVSDGEADGAKCVCKFGQGQGGAKRFAATAYQAGRAAGTDERVCSCDDLGVTIVGDEKTAVRADAVEIGQRAINRRPREVHRNTDPHDQARSCRVESRLVETLGQTIAFEISRNPADSRVDSTVGAFQ